MISFRFSSDRTAGTGRMSRYGESGTHFVSYPQIFGSSGGRSE